MKKKPRQSAKFGQSSTADQFVNQNPRKLDRVKGSIPKRKKLLIVCEGENTEPSYFENFRLSTVEIVVVGSGKSSIELIEKTARRPDIKKYDEIWCVYDRDDRLASFNESLRLAEKHGFKVAYSIQAFEYWIFLHFFEHNGSPLDRVECKKRINKYLNQFGCSYGDMTGKKIDTKIWFLLHRVDANSGKTHEELAINRAKKVYDSYDHKNPVKEESSTTVFMLVEELIKFRQIA